MTKPPGHIGFDLPVNDSMQQLCDFDSLNWDSTYDILKHDQDADQTLAEACQEPCEDILGLAAASILSPNSTAAGVDLELPLLHDACDVWPDGMADGLVSDSDEDSLFRSLRGEVLLDEQSPAATQAIEDPAVVSSDSRKNVSDDTRGLSVLPDSLGLLDDINSQPVDGPAPSLDSHLPCRSSHSEDADNVMVVPEPAAMGELHTADKVITAEVTADGNPVVICDSGAPSSGSALEDHAYSFICGESASGLSSAASPACVDVAIRFVNVPAVADAAVCKSRYAERRRKNNEASRVCRQQRKRKIVELSTSIASLETDNACLKVQVRDLEAMVERAQAILAESVLLVQATKAAPTSAVGDSSSSRPAQ